MILKKGDLLYLTTDGLIDQNNRERTRYGSPRFFELIKRNVKFNLNDQKQIIENSLSEFQRSAEQRDDVTIIGIKI